MADEKTMTAAKAIIKVNGKAVGLMSNLRITENNQLGSVMGLGRVTKVEVPILSITCTWACDFYMIDLVKSGIPGLDNKAVQSLDEYVDSKVLVPNVVDIVVYKKDVKTITNGVVTATKGNVLAVIRDVYLNSTGWSIQENSITQLQQSGEYLTPVFLSI